jgi:very-short-patch-repair endonuclease
MVLAQVQRSRFLQVKKGVPRTAWQNRISQKSVDFVVCLKDSTVVAVVELDDSTHDHGSRRKADADKDKALTSANVQIVRWTSKALPDESAIRAAFTS